MLDPFFTFFNVLCCTYLHTFSIYCMHVKSCCINIAFASDYENHDFAVFALHVANTLQNPCPDIFFKAKTAKPLRILNVSQHNRGSRVPLIIHVCNVFSTLISTQECLNFCARENVSPSRLMDCDKLFMLAESSSSLF